jgi:hypothetical protein
MLPFREEREAAKKMSYSMTLPSPLHDLYREEIAFACVVTLAPRQCINDFR